MKIVRGINLGIAGDWVAELYGEPAKDFFDIHSITLTPDAPGKQNSVTLPILDPLFDVLEEALCRDPAVLESVKRLVESGL